MPGFVTWIFMMDKMMEKKTPRRRKFWKQPGCFGWSMLLEIVAGNEVGRETFSLVKKSCRIWGHVCQNHRKYYQRMIPTSFVLGAFMIKKNRPGKILVGFLMIQVHPPVLSFVSSHSRHIHVPSLKFCNRLRGCQLSWLEVQSPESSVKCEVSKDPTFGRGPFQKGDPDISGRDWFHKLCLFR